jgi:hypothetical protein
MIITTARVKELQRHPRFLLALPAAALAVTLAACGGSSGSPSSKPTGAAHSQPAATHAAPAQTANPIPQGNGGDHDADNNGGPSDGDGNI